MSEPNLPDYSNEEQEPDQDGLTRLKNLTLKMAQLTIQVDDLEEQLKAAKKELRKYEEDFIPELMEEIGLTDLKTAGGIRVEMKQEVRASFPKDPEKSQAAMEYLRATGNDGIVKRQFVIQYGRDSTEWANQFAQKLTEMGVHDHAAVEDYSSIHNQTLLKFLRDQIKSGAPVPLEAFGAFVQKIAKIKRG